MLNASENCRSFDHSNFVPGGIHRICCLRAWSPYIIASQ